MLRAFNEKFVVRYATYTKARVSAVVLECTNEYAVVTSNTNFEEFKSIKVLLLKGIKEVRIMDHSLKSNTGILYSKEFVVKNQDKYSNDLKQLALKKLRMLKKFGYTCS